MVQFAETEHKELEANLDEVDYSKIGEKWPSVFLDHIKDLLDGLEPRELSLEDKWRRDELYKLL